MSEHELNAPSAYAMLGCSPSASDEELRRCFRRQALALHPDKRRGIDDDDFQKLSAAYARVMQARNRPRESDPLGFDPATVFKSLFGETEGQSSFSPERLACHFKPSTLMRSMSHGQPEATGNLSGYDTDLPSAESQPCCSAQTNDVSSDAATLDMPRVVRRKLNDMRPDGSMLPQHKVFATPQERPRNISQVLTLTLEELYAGCTKRLLLTHTGLCGSVSAAAGFAEQEVLEVAVAPGWREGTRVTFQGRGTPMSTGGPRPDIVFVVREELHPRFERRGDDLVTRVRVPLVTALTGGAVQLMSLDKRLLNLQLHGVTSPGAVQVLHGEGMPNVQGRPRRGDLHVCFDVHFPDLLDNQQQRLVRLALTQEQAEDDMDSVGGN